VQLVVVPRVPSNLHPLHFLSLGQFPRIKMLRTSFERAVSNLGNKNSHIELGGDDAVSPSDRLNRPPAISTAGTDEEKQILIPTRESTSEAGSTICSIVSRAKLVSPDKIQEYEKLLEEMANVCHTNFKGHLYSGLVEQSKTGNVVSVHRFDTIGHLQTWMTSEERSKYIERFTKLINPESVHVDVVEGATHLFDSSDASIPGSGKPEARPPPLWKVLVIVIVVLYPMSLVLGLTLVVALAKQGFNSITLTALVNAMILPIAIWFVFPALFICFKKWLLKPRPVYPRYSLMFFLDSGLSVFKPSNPDLITPVQEAMINRISVAESLISTLQERIRLLEHGDKLSDAEVEQMIAAKDLQSDKAAQILKEKIYADAAREHNVNYPVTVKVALQIPAAYTKTYEKFVKDLGRAASEFEGFIGLNIIRPAHLDAKGSGIYVSITRFQNHSQLIKWLTSRERKELLVQIQPFVTLISGEIESDKVMFSDGFDNFFPSTLPAGADIDPKKAPAPPPKWKTFILTYIILLGNSVFFSTFIAPLYNKRVPSAVASLISFVLNLFMSSYFVTPLANKIFQDCLHTYTQHEVPKSWIGKCLHIGIPGLG
jgi:antibiotic biosynthesis monooxygenase (ABM) superfamily enzyme